MIDFNLLMKVVKNVQFFCDVDDNDQFYAEFTVHGKKKFESIESQKFKSFLFAKSIDLSENAPNLDPNSAVQSLRWLLINNQNFTYTEVYSRTSGTLNDFIEYDLQNEEQKSVIITREGWDVVQKERKFIASKASLPQVKPVRTNKSPLELLGKFANVYSDAYILFVIWTIQAFIRGSHHILWVLADRGSGKSTLSKIIKKIVDPSKFTVTTIPDKKDDIRVLLNSTHLCCFDNLSRISNDVSDLFCGAVGGTSVVKRSLYTNSDINVSTLYNTLVLNGIGYCPERDDLSERMLILKLQKLSSEKLKSEKEIWREFEEALPEILGSIFNTLSRALVEIENVEKKNLPRMADAFIEMLAIARALGISEEEFRRIYDENQKELSLARIGSPVVTAFKEYMQKIPERKIEMYADEFYNEVLANFSGDKSLLPGSAAHFDQKLDKEFHNILKAGYRVNFDDTSSKGTVVTVIRKK